MPTIYVGEDMESRCLAQYWKESSMTDFDIVTKPKLTPGDDSVFIGVKMSQSDAEFLIRVNLTMSSCVSFITHDKETYHNFIKAYSDYKEYNIDVKYIEPGSMFRDIVKSQYINKPTMNFDLSYDGKNIANVNFDEFAEDNLCLPTFNQIVDALGVWSTDGLVTDIPLNNSIKVLEEGTEGLIIAMHKDLQEYRKQVQAQHKEMYL